MTGSIDRREALMMAGALAATATTPGAARAAAGDDAAKPDLKVVIPSHVAIDIAGRPDAVWREICEQYVEARKIRTYAKVETLDDPAATFGGYRMRVEKDGAVVDDRIVHIVERDDAARRLGIYAQYLSVPGMEVYANYHAGQTATGTRYRIDCFTRIAIPTPPGGKRQDVATAIAAMQADFDKALMGYLGNVKTRIETAG